MQISKYKEIGDLFALAEKKIKKIEQLEHEGLSIHSVNQLRYAGQHCLASLVIDDDKEIENNIFQAKDHCKRAIYDAMEIGIVYLLKRIKIFIEDYKLVTINNIIPDYINKLRRVDEIKSYIADTSRQEVGEDYERIQKLFDEIYEIEDIFNSARPELSKKINIWRQRLILAIIALSIALIGVLVTLLNC